MTLTMDIEPFVAAQNNLREQAGTLVVFKLPTEPKWPIGTKINPTTKRPYDPTIVQENEGFTEKSIKALVILKQGSPLRPQTDTEMEPVGLQSGMDIILDVSAAGKTEIEDATRMVVNGLEYRVLEFKPFAIGEVIYRYLCYGQEF